MTDLRLQYVIEAIDRSTATVANIGKNIGKSIDVGVRGFERISKSAETVQGAIAGIGLGIAAEIGTKEIVRTAEYFDRLRITTGASADAIAEVKDRLIETAGAARINSDELTAAFKSMKDNGASLDFFKDNIEGVARNIQLLGGSGDELGQSWSVLARNFNLTKPADLAQAFSTLRAQLIGIDGGFTEMAPKLGRLSASYRAIGQTGLGASKDLGALFAIVRLGTATSREAVSQVSSLIGYFNDKGGQDAIASLGVKVFATDADRRARKVRPVPDILNDIAKVYQQNPAFVENRLGSGFINPLKVGFGELQTNGSLTTLNQRRAITGDVDADSKKASQIAQEPTSVLNAIVDRMKAIGEVAGDIALNIARIPGEGFVNFLGDLAAAATATLLLGGAVKYVFPLLGTGVGTIVQIGSAALKTGPALVGLALRTAAIAESIAALGAGVPAVSGLFTAISSGFLSVGLAIEATPIGWILTGIAAIAAGAYLIYEYWKPIKDFFAHLWDGIKMPSSWMAAQQAEAGMIPDVGPGAEPGSSSSDGPKPLSQSDLDGFKRRGQIDFSPNGRRSFGPAGRTILGAGDGQHLPLGPQKVEITLKFQDAPEGLAVVDKRSSSGSVDVQLDPSFGVSLGSVP